EAAQDAHEVRVHGAQRHAGAEHQGDRRRLDPHAGDARQVGERGVDVEAGAAQGGEREAPARGQKGREGRLDGAGLLRRPAGHLDGFLDLGGRRLEHVHPGGEAAAQGTIGALREGIVGRLGEDGADEAHDRILPPPPDRAIGPPEPFEHPSHEGPGGAGAHADEFVSSDHQVSPNGRASTSNDQADRSWRAIATTVWATASGLTKKLSGLPGMRSRVRGRSTTPSMITTATWIPDGHKWRAIDSASVRCAALADANPALRAPPFREAVAPMNTIAPPPCAFIAGMTWRDATNAPSALMRHADSNASTDSSSTLPTTPEPALYTSTATSPRASRAAATAG